MENRIKLRSYLKNKFDVYIRPIYILDKCEKCGCDKELELHHNKQFAELLKESLNDIGLQYKMYKDFYNEEELKKIVDIFLGKNIKISYKTLCRECHRLIHKNEMKIQIFLRESNMKAIDNNKYIICLYDDNKIYKKIFTYEDKLHNDNKSIEQVCVNGNDSIQLLSSNGKIMKVKVEDIKSVPTTISIDFKVIKIFKMDDFKNEKLNIIFLTKLGFVKRLNIKLSRFDSFYPVLNCLIDSKDELIDMCIAKDDDLVFVCSDTGNGYALNVNKIKPTGRNSKGTKIRAKYNKTFVSLNNLTNNKNMFIFTVTKCGYAKCTPCNEYIKILKGHGSMITHRINKDTGNVIYAKIVSPHDSIITCIDLEYIRIKISNIPLSSRSSFGSKITNSKFGKINVMRHIAVE